MVAVNSINFARIMAQIVYYFYAATRLGGDDETISFSVPTGNFGDALAGYVASRCGLLNRLEITAAVNANNVLYDVDSACCVPPRVLDAE